MRAWFALPSRAPARAVEATTNDQLVATGAVLGSWGRDPVDGDIGWKQAGPAGRPVPFWTQEKARTYSVNAYRANPMARAIVDTYTSFCVGAEGLSLLVTSPQVRDVAQEFWDDPAVNLGGIQELMLRDQMLNGETVLEMLVGEGSGATRFCPIDPSRVTEVQLRDGNPLWPGKLVFGDTPDSGEGPTLTVAAVDDATGLRTGEAIFWTPWKALLTDRRGMPFLAQILDQLDAYDTIISNLIDRTALARYLVWDVTVKGGQDAVDNFVTSRGSLAIPQSGSVEVHNDSVTWEPKTAPTGAMEDSTAAGTVLTEIAGGAGLSKHWLAEPDGVNRATSMSMAEPVRRRVGGVQKVWLAYQTELVRYAVDQAVRAGRLPTMVEAVDPRTRQIYEVPAASTVTVTGPEIAAADAQVTAQVLLNLSTGLANFVKAGVMSPGAAAVAAQKAWEQFVGIPYREDLGAADANPDDVATYVDDQSGQPATEARPGGSAARLKHYWTRGEGLRKWADHPHPWTALRDHLAKYMTPEMADRTASQWFHDTFGIWPGERRGKNPVGRG